MSNSTSNPKILGKIALIEKPSRHSYAVCIRCNRKIYNGMNMVSYKKEIINGRLLTTEIICIECSLYEDIY